MDRGLLARILASLLVLIALFSLLTPWWGASASFSGGGFGMPEQDESAGPFDDGNGMIEDGEALTAGLLTLLAVLAAAAGATLAWMNLRVREAALLVGFAGVLILVVAILAPTAWPQEGMGFWDSDKETFNGMTVEASVYAHVGWYLGIVSVPLAAAAAVLLLTSPSGSPRVRLAGDGPSWLAQYATPAQQPVATPAGGPAAAPPATPRAVRAAPAAPAAAPASAEGGRCIATTKSGSQCARKATANGRCPTHA